MNMEDELYNAFGELIYILVCADGEIQQEELDTLDTILKDHHWAKDIQWSFNYERDKENNLDELYKKVIYKCFDIGPHPEYRYMIEVLEKIAESSLGKDEDEAKIIQDFEDDLIEHFSEMY